MKYYAPFFKFKTMKYIGISLIYIAFFSLIGFAIFYTKSAYCLWALLLTPKWESKSEDNE